MMKTGGYMNKYIKELLTTTLIFLLMLIIIPTSVLATTYDLIAPSGQLVRGQNVQFTININTEDKSLASSAIGMTYDTQYLEYVSVSPGNTFTTVSTDVQAGGKLIITGSSTTPYSGSGVFAYVTFKLIATSSGSTQLCVLFNPTSSTPTPAPTSTPVPGVPTSTPAPGETIAPTSLPKTGESAPMTKGILFGSSLFILATAGFFIFKRI
ncbi:MAG: hypothetical protein ACD_12C00658G0015 [uncultured bacterium]|nr:MAG: hypothetical protein ACD_12C00658G0015 [uncultured bacterium]